MDDGILIGPKPGDLDAIIELLKAPVTGNGSKPTGHSISRMRAHSGSDP
jgi:hypothetical protein